METKLNFSVPPFPPSTILLFFVTLNLSFSFLYPNYALYPFFAYYFGFLLLVQNPEQLVSKEGLLINLFCALFTLYGLPMSKNQQLIILIVMCIIHYRFILRGIKNIFECLTLKPVQFDAVFFSIQLGIVIEFFTFFTGAKWLRVLPVFIRIVLNLRIFTLLSFIGIIRFSFKVSLVYLEFNSLPWIYIQTLLSVWETGVDFFIQFKMTRVFSQKAPTFYPKPIILWLFLIDSFLQWTWYFGGIHVGTLMIIKKISWNYLKLEARATDRPLETIIEAILKKSIIRRQISEISL